jgi:hypothetical protein
MSVAEHDGARAPGKASSPYWPLGAVALVVLLGHLTLFPKIADLDGFYHLGHATAYAEGSPFDTSFPWATQSVIAERGADMWWGFHVLLMPFAAIDDVEWGMRAAALALTLVLAASVHWILRRHGVAGAGWWTVAFLVAVPNVFFRYVMLRPHMLSLAASLFLLSVLVRGRWAHALLASSLVTWLHLSLFWMAPGIVAAYALVRAIERAAGVAAEDTAAVPPLPAIGAVLVGTALGWLLRPHPIEAGALAGVQIIRLFAEKGTEEPLLFAAELFPLPLGSLLRSSWLFAAAWLGAVGATLTFSVRGRRTPLAREEHTLLLTTLLVSAVFLLLVLFSARRALVEWVAFGSLALPLVWACLAPRDWARRHRPLAACGALVLVGHLAWGAWRHHLNVDLVAFAPDTMEGPAVFLAASGEPGDVVFHAKWDNFGPLFARNRASLYLGGMDPIFQFAHDARRYWEFFYLSADLTTEWTCDAYPCQNGSATDTHRVLREHFGARWIVVEPARNPRLSLYLLGDPRFELRHESQREAVFEVLPAAAPSPTPMPPAE